MLAARNLKWDCVTDKSVRDCSLKVFIPHSAIPLATGLKSIDSAPKKKLLGDFIRKISMQKATGPRSQNFWLATKVEC